MTLLLLLLLLLLLRKSMDAECIMYPPAACAEFFDRWFYDWRGCLRSPVVKLFWR